MTAPLVVPFNFAPVSVAVKTGSYTVPVGQYAYVTAVVAGTSTFTIDAVTALVGTENTVLASDNLRIGQASGSTVTNALEVNTAASSDTVQAVGSAFNESTDQKPVVGNYWIPAGTVINGSGTWRAVVSLYNNIT